jgi:hypothetical protein
MGRALAFAAVLSACAPRCSPDQGVGAESESRFAARLVLWEQHRCSNPAVIRASPDSRWVAIHENTGRLRVRLLSEDYQVGAAVLDTQDAGIIVHDCTWCGDELVYVRTRSPSPDEAAHMPDGIDVPAYWPIEYRIANSRTMALAPATGAERVVLTDGYTALLADKAGRRLIAFNRFSEMPGQPGIETRAEVFRLPGLELAHKFSLAAPREAGGTALRPAYPWPLAWHPESDLVFYVNDPMIPTSPEYPWPVPVLASVSMDGTLGQLTDVTSNCMVQGMPWRVPVPSLLHGGSSIAVLVNRRHGGYGIGVFDSTGLTKWYRFGVRFDFPEELSKLGKGWELITCTNEGRHALFQRKPFSDTDDPEAPRPLWVWDLEEGWGQHLADLRQIRLCFGWLSGDGLVIGLAAEGRPVWSGLIDYGVLRLSRGD